MIDFSKPVWTKGHNKVTILSTVAYGGYPIVGQIENQTNIETWTEGGRNYHAYPGSLDLENIPETPAPKPSVPDSLKKAFEAGFDKGYLNGKITKSEELKEAFEIGFEKGWVGHHIPCANLDDCIEIEWENSLIFKNLNLEALKG